MERKMMMGRARRCVSNGQPRYSGEEEEKEEGDPQHGKFSLFSFASRLVHVCLTFLKRVKSWQRILLRRGGCGVEQWEIQADHWARRLEVALTCLRRHFQRST